MGAHLYPAQHHHLSSRKLRGSSFRCLIALLKHSSKGKASQLHLGYSPKLGSLGHPFSFTPRGLVSMRKCLTSSLVMSPEKRPNVVTPELPSSFSSLHHPTAIPLAHPQSPSWNQILCTPQAALLVGCAHFTMPKPRGRCPPALYVWYVPMTWGMAEAGREGCCHISTYPRAVWLSSPGCPLNRNNRKHLSVGRRRTHNTFLVLLHDGGRWGSHFHGKAIGSPEGVAVPDDESPWLPVLQQCDGWGREGESSDLAC